MEKRIMTIEELVEIGDKIHNAKELICLTHSIENEEHDIFFAMIGDDKELAHLVAKQFCENRELFTVVEAALQKLGYSIISNENLKELIINNIEQ